MPKKPAKLKKGTPAAKRNMARVRAFKTQKRTLQGEGITDWAKSAYNWGKTKVYEPLSKSKVISRTADFLDSFGVPYAGDASKLAKRVGLGKGVKGAGQRTMLDVGLLPR